MQRTMMSRVKREKQMMAYVHVKEQTQCTKHRQHLRLLTLPHKSVCVCALTSKLQAWHVKLHKHAVQDICN